jgi:hypothetical protein
MFTVYLVTSMTYGRIRQGTSLANHTRHIVNLDRETNLIVLPITGKSVKQYHFYHSMMVRTGLE